MELKIKNLKPREIENAVNKWQDQNPDKYFPTFIGVNEEDFKIFFIGFSKGLKISKDPQFNPVEFAEKETKRIIAGETNFYFYGVPVTIVLDLSEKSIKIE